MKENDSILFKVDVENYKGPLDVLLDLAKAQKVNLEDISITKLADQFHNFITKEKNLNLEIASEYLLIATWLAYLKSKLLLPGTPEEEFKVQEVAEKLKLQLKKLELIRLLSEQMLKRKRLGREIRTRGSRAGIRPIYNSEYKLNLFELLKTYSIIIMTKDFQKMNIPKLPVFTTEEGIKTIKNFFGKLIDWKKLDDLIPKGFKQGNKYKRTGKAGIFAGSLELVKEGNLKIKQNKAENLIESEVTIKDYKSMLLSDYQFYLPEMMMYKIDRTSMANSIETRSPFVDHELIEYVFSHTTEYTEGQGQKQVLKDYLVGDFGKEFVNRKKQGFVFDIESWIFNNVNYFYENIKNSHLSNYIDLTSLNLLKLNKSRINSHRIWKLYVLGKFIN